MYYNNSEKRLWILIYVVLSVQITGVCQNEPLSSDVKYRLPSVQETAEIKFHDVASGGTLFLCESMSNTARYISVETTPGEPADSIAKRLSEAINATSPFLAGNPIPYTVAVGGTLKGLIGTRARYFLAGDEIGLGIPPAPKSLTALYDKQTDQIHVQWENPDYVYDSICLNLFFNGSSRTESLSGTTSHFIIDRKKEPFRSIGLNPDDLGIRIVGFTEDTPSHAAAIQLSSGGRAQEEIYEIPFVNEPAPNWEMWSHGNPIRKEQVTSLERKEKSNRSLQKKKQYNPVTNPEDKPFQQILHASKNENIGVCRRFVGLDPNHTYVVEVRLNTLEMSANDNSWSFSMSAMSNEKSKELTSAQMAGIDTLPSGKVKKQALLNSKTATHGQYINKRRDIKILPGEDTITVWILFNGGEKGGEVGIDNIRLLDIGVIEKGVTISMPD